MPPAPTDGPFQGPWCLPGHPRGSVLPAGLQEKVQMPQNRPWAPPESPAWQAALSSDLPVTARHPQACGQAGIHL